MSSKNVPHIVVSFLLETYQSSDEFSSHILQIHKLFLCGIVGLQPFTFKRTSADGLAAEKHPVSMPAFHKQFQA
jgi:hypothetical protein